MLLCVATVILWGTSLHWEALCTHTSFSPHGANWRWLNWQVWSEDGFLRWASFDIEVNTPIFDNNFVEKAGQWNLKVQPSGTSGSRTRFPTNLRPRWDTSTGVFAPTRRDVIGSRFVGIILPYWIPLALTIPLPAFWMFRRRRKTQRIRTRLCLSCGYDLRASTDRCPECGTPIPVTQEPASISN